MNILVQLNSPLGSGLGPTFTISPNVGSINPTTATAAGLLGGGELFTLTDPTATSVTLTSVGACTNPITISITNPFNPGTTSTTTPSLIQCLVLSLGTGSTKICGGSFDEEFAPVGIAYTINGLPTPAPFPITLSFTYTPSIGSPTTESLVIPTGSISASQNYVTKTLLDCNDPNSIKTWRLTNFTVSPNTIPICSSTTSTTTTPPIGGDCVCVILENISASVQDSPTFLCDQGGIIPAPTSTVAPGQSIFITLTLQQIGTLDPLIWNWVLCG